MSILLLAGFVGGVALALVAIVAQLFPDADDRTASLIASAVAACCALAAWLHWRRFMVPITVAAGSAAAAGVIGGLVMAAVPRFDQLPFILMLGAGLALFAAAAPASAFASATPTATPAVTPAAAADDGG